MFAAVAIAILGCCAVIDLLSGQPGRAGGAGFILVVVGIWLVYALINDAVKEHKERKEQLEAFNRSREEYRLKQQQEIQKLKQQYPGLTEYQYDQLYWMSRSTREWYAKNNFQTLKKFKD